MGSGEPPLHPPAAQGYQEAKNLGPTSTILRIIDDQGHTIIAPFPFDLATPLLIGKAIVHDGAALWKWTRSVNAGDQTSNDFGDLPFEPVG